MDLANYACAGVKVLKLDVGTCFLEALGSRKLYVRWCKSTETGRTRQANQRREARKPDDDDENKGFARARTGKVLNLYYAVRCLGSPGRGLGVGVRWRTTRVLLAY